MRSLCVRWTSFSRTQAAILSNLINNEEYPTCQTFRGNGMHVIRCKRNAFFYELDVDGDLFRISRPTKAIDRMRKEEIDLSHPRHWNVGGFRSIRLGSNFERSVAWQVGCTNTSVWFVLCVLGIVTFPFLPIIHVSFFHNSMRRGIERPFLPCSSHGLSIVFPDGSTTEGRRQSYEDLPSSVFLSVLRLVDRWVSWFEIFPPSHSFLSFFLSRRT